MDASTKWNGIVFNGNSASGSIMSYCDLMNVETTGGPAITLLSVYGNPEFSNCNISSVSGTNSSGIHFNNSNGYLVRNTINSNHIGVYLSNGSSPSFGKSGYTHSCTGYGNNNINNNQYGVRIASGCIRIYWR